ncbi:hypothetical protein OUZ56_026850 [Daphnia magna]|uniref:Uncharacterized protein n=1 Tax=Daphnia magna TaxID=35525 RepID=A0ABQ9ZN10_9CRUS|nr:hypothetical protein OUZ56_026850 [Daphnia magna]
MDIVKCSIGRSRPSRLADDRQMDEWMDRFSLNAKTTCCLRNDDYTFGTKELPVDLACGYVPVTNGPVFIHHQNGD